MRNQRQPKKQQFKNVRIEIPVKFNARIPQEAKDDLLAVLADPIIEKITINVFAFRSVINNNSEVKGNIIVGNVIKYDAEKEVLIVDIYERFAEVMDTIQNKIGFVFTSYDPETKINKINRIIIEEARD